MVVECHAFVRMGGAEYQAHLLAQELSRRPGVSVTYVGRHVPAPGGLSYELCRIGHEGRLRSRAVFFDAGELWAALARLQPDVIYQRIRQSYTGVCAMYGARNRTPVVFHSASDPDVGGAGLRRSWSANLPFEIVESMAGQWGVRRVSHVIVQTEQQRSLLQRNFGRDATAVVRNFQPLPTVLPARPPGPTRVVWIGNVKEIKRPDLFLRLAERFSGRTDVQFCMVGRPSPNRRQRPLMTAIANSRDLTYAGELSLEEVNALLGEADILVNTSAFEGSPNTFIQAWAQGAVVMSLTVDVDGGLDALGIGCRAGTLDGLVECIERLVRVPRLRNEIAERAFAHVQRMHSLDNAGRLADIVLAARRQA